MMRSIILNVSFLLVNLLLSFPINALASHSFNTIQLPTRGSEAYAFDSDNNGPYTGLNDGRIVKFEVGPRTGFVDFATTAPNRSKDLCDGSKGDEPKTVSLCGRTLGLEFNHKTGDLYVIDAFRGLMVVGSGGGLAARLPGGKDGVPFDALSIDPISGDVYFTDVGSIFFKTKNITEILVSGDRSGRLLKYEPKTKRRTVVLTGLAVPIGVAVSRDGSFVLIAEYIECRIRRFWVKGPKAFTWDIFVQLPGNPDNIKRTKSGDFWVAVNVQKLYPELISFPLGQMISASGKIMETVNFYGEYNATSVTEVQEHFGSIYVASVFSSFVGIYKGLKC